MVTIIGKIPSKIEWDLSNGPLSKLLELSDTQVWGSIQWVLLEISWKNAGNHFSYETRAVFIHSLRKKPHLSLSRHSGYETTRDGRPRRRLGEQPASMGATKPTCLEVFMVNNLVFRWPKPVFLMVLGAHGKYPFICL